MTVELDHLDVEGKREFVISMVIIGLFLSHATFAGRIWAKISYSGKLHAEDWFMAAALLMTYSFAVCEFYGNQGQAPRESHCTNSVRLGSWSWKTPNSGIKSGLGQNEYSK